MTKRKTKTFLYIDGTNLLAGLVELFGYNKIPSFASIIKIAKKYFVIDRIFFYASYTSRKYVRSAKILKYVELEKNFFNQVKNTKNLVFYKGYRSPTSKKEKGVDVHLAVDIVKDAFLEKYKNAIIMTGDADLIYPVETVKTLFQKPVFSVFIPSRFSLEIAYKTDKALVLNYMRSFKPQLFKKLPKRLVIADTKKPRIRMRGRLKT